MDVILLLIRLFLFAVFVVAGSAKLLDSKGSVRSAEDFGVPESLSKAFSIVLPIVELLVAIGFLFLDYSWYSAILALLLMSVFIGGMIYQIWQGNAPNCHCFGQLSKEPIGNKSLIRNAVFAAASIILIISGREFQGLSAVSWLVNLSNGERMQFVFGLLIVCLIAFAVYYLSKILEQTKSISQQFEIMEFLSKETSEPVEREDVLVPQVGLPIGTPLPKFSLSNSLGKNILLNDLLLENKPILFFFVAPTCNPCQQLLPEIDGWQAEFEAKIKFVFVSSGKPKDNIAKFGRERTVLIESEREIADLLGATWTPSAILVSREGSIASRPAVGDIAIHELIKSTRKLDFTKKVLAIKANTSSKLGDKIGEFELKNTLGSTTKSSDFSDKKTLAVFWSIKCPHCEAFLAEFSNWDVSKDASDLNLILFSTGTNGNLGDLGFRSPIATDPEWKVSNMLGMYGTPSAVLINEHGQIASETLSGAKEIMAMVGK
jgi:thiol-disulfide isomerase/thioredoxin/uncharacterized membrane protein YphA (DoxX/SURF4 family)